MIHKLKINPEYLENLINGKKKSEIRLNDRDYQIGDALQFEQYSRPMDSLLGLYEKTNVHFLITHIHSGLGLKEGYVVLSVERVNRNGTD